MPHYLHRALLTLIQEVLQAVKLNTLPSYMSLDSVHRDAVIKHLEFWASGAGTIKTSDVYKTIAANPQTDKVMAEMGIL